MLTSNIKTRLEEILNSPIDSTAPVSGGSINETYRITTGQADYFLKLNRSAPNDFFEKEAQGLKLLDSAGSTLRIPEVIASEPPTDSCPGFLLMGFIHEGRTGDSFAFGAELAKLHQTASETFGLDSDNYIGSLLQSNNRHNAWSTFFTEERINPQLKMAIDSGKIDAGILKNWERLSRKLDDLLPACKPSLIHGDLWSGNYLFDESGKGVLIDPAVYYGHPEMDLAFSKMFGGFSSDFYNGYESITQLEPDFNGRKEIYNLYPLLVHVNLFGGHYTSQAVRFLKQF